MKFDELKAQRANRDALEQALREAGADIKGTTVRCPFHEDNHASGSIHEKDGIWRFKCHACGWGGDLIDVMKEAGTMAKPTMATPKPKTTPRPQSLDEIRKYLTRGIGPIELEHTYHDTDGNEIMHVIRCKTTDGKTYRHVRREDDGWVLGQLAKPWPLYRLPEILSAETVVICEGEKATDSLHEQGILATTGPHGAGKADYCDWTPLKGKRVILWPDPDEQGHDHMNDVQRILTGLGCTLKRINPADLDLVEKEDACDYFAQLRNAGVEDLHGEVLRALSKAQSQSPSTGLLVQIEETIAGQRENIPWPWQKLTHLSRALMPSAITLICGDPGDGKSFLMLQCLAFWITQGVRACIFELEDDRAYHLARMLAQKEGNSNLIDAKWMRDHPQESRQAYERHQPFLDQAGRLITEGPDKEITQDELAQWIERQAQAGSRVIICDPVTACVQSDKPWIDDKRFLTKVKTAARNYKVSVILVTHNRKTDRQHRAPTLNDLAGGAAYQRFAHNILWIQRHKPSREGLVKTDCGRIQMTHNRTIHICKSRNGPGAGLQLAYNFDLDSLLFVEQGIVVSNSK